MTRDEDLEATIVAKFVVMAPVLNERARRLWAAAESIAIGYGGDALVSAATGLAPETIRKGRRELAVGDGAAPGRIRRAGAGRPNLEQDQPGLTAALERLVDPLTRGDPMSPLRWTCKSRAQLTAALTADGWRVSSSAIGRLLHALGYRLQALRKTREGRQHPDRNAQFEHINATAASFLQHGQPVISVDTKKKELIGNYENKGRQWRRSKSPALVQGHDFPAPSVPRASPYGVYDLARNKGFVNVGTDHDTGAFAVASIRGGWRFEGHRLYPRARRLLITADGGGSNGYRLRLWKFELQKLADATTLAIEVCHFPPGTSKWNKVEHRLFSFISSNWRGEPLRDYETIVRLIASTTTAKGLAVSCRLDRRKYPSGRRVTDDEMKTIRITPQAFHGEWNYVIRPRSRRA